MKIQDTIDFNRIKDAIQYLDTNYKQQPSLDDVAEYIHLSSTHFQRMFTEWAGVSPKQFLQYTTISHAKDLLKRGKESLLNTSFDLGLSSSSRLHDLFVHVEAMTPGEYKDGGAKLSLCYQMANTLFGSVLIASTDKGICNLQFVDDEGAGLAELRAEYPHASINKSDNDNQYKAISFLSDTNFNLKNLKLHLRGTDFQLKVWEALLKIPFGELVSYGDLAHKIGSPMASRAVGTAIGSNPVAYLIPCHRVIQNTGTFGGYRWDISRKKAIIGWESIHD